MFIVFHVSFFFLIISWKHVERCRQPSPCPVSASLFTQDVLYHNHSSRAVIDRVCIWECQGCVSNLFHAIVCVLPIVHKVPEKISPCPVSVCFDSVRTCIVWDTFVCLRTLRICVSRAYSLWPLFFYTFFLHRCWEDSGRVRMFGSCVSSSRRSWREPKQNRSMCALCDRRYPSGNSSE